MKFMKLNLKLAIVFFTLLFIVLLLIRVKLATDTFNEVKTLEQSNKSLTAKLDSINRSSAKCD